MLSMHSQDLFSSNWTAVLMLRGEGGFSFTTCHPLCITKNKQQWIHRCSVTEPLAAIHFPVKATLSLKLTLIDDSAEFIVHEKELLYHQFASVTASNVVTTHIHRPTLPEAIAAVNSRGKEVRSIHIAFPLITPTYQRSPDQSRL